MSFFQNFSFVGWFKDLTGNWLLSFRTAGCLSIMSGVLVMLDPLITRCCHKHTTKEPDELSKGVKNNAFEE